MRTMRFMEWIRYYPLRAAALAVVLVLAGMGVFLVTTGSGGEPLESTQQATSAPSTDTGSQDVTVPTETTSLVNPAAVSPSDVPDSVNEFVTLLNELNAYVSIGDNNQLSGQLYEALWQKGEAAGLEVYGLEGDRLDRRMTIPSAYEVLELVTLQGTRLCVPEVTRYDPRATAAPYLYQGLYFGSCQAMLEDLSSR